MAKLRIDTVLPDNIVMHDHGVEDLLTTGTPSATTFLRGDMTWATPAGGSTDFNVDGGQANTVFTPIPGIDGGTA